MGQRKTRLTDDQLTAARVAFDGRGTWAEIAKVAGCAISTIRDHAKREGWERAALTDEERRAQMRAAKAEQIERWSQRRAREADEAGVTAASVRAAAEKAVRNDNPQMVRACGIFYGILIDKAQLLSGGATGRVDSSTPDERRRRLRDTNDELAARRGVPPEALKATG